MKLFLKLFLMHLVHVQRGDVILESCVPRLVLSLSVLPSGLQGLRSGEPVMEDMDVLSMNLYETAIESMSIGSGL